MNLAQFGRPERSEGGRRKADDWKLQAPRWVLLGLLMLTSGYIGIQATQNHYLESSLQDGPTKFQQRQGERLAALEAQVNGLTKAVEANGVKSDVQSQAIVELTTQVRQLMARR